MLKIKPVIKLFYSGYQTLVRWYGIVPVIAVVLIIFISSTVIIYNIIENSSATATTLVSATPVTITTANTYHPNFSGTLIGTAVAKTEATLLTERGGQVTHVSITLGQFVNAGTILAQFTNDSERAALTQARGAYESALASAKQSALSITDAENAVVDSKRAVVIAHNNAQATVSSIITANVDEFFSDPNNSTPGLRIDGLGRATELNRLRVAIREQLKTWQKNTTTLTLNDDPSEELAHAHETITNTIELVDAFILIFQKVRSDELYSLDDYRDFIATFTAKRSILNDLLNSLATVESNLINAKENVTRATLSGGSDSSLASAQITQARGTLQAAEANYNKTIIRTPISGTIATLAVRAGDYVSPQSLVAKITNTDGVEITTYISETEKKYFNIGDLVRIDNIATGTVSALSPAIDNRTQKIEMRIAVSDTSISPGSTVSLSLPEKQIITDSATTPIIIPITAIKFNNTSGSIFVVENNKLVAKSVTLGTITGTVVTILDGIDHDTEFVVDARGKNAGEQVIVTRQ